MGRTSPGPDPATSVCTLRCLRLLELWLLDPGRVQAVAEGLLQVRDPKQIEFFPASERWPVVGLVGTVKLSFYKQLYVQGKQLHERSEQSLGGHTSLREMRVVDVGHRASQLSCCRGESVAG